MWGEGKGIERAFKNSITQITILGEIEKLIRYETHDPSGS